jgi:hypothetical protein
MGAQLASEFKAQATAAAGNERGLTREIGPVASLEQLQSDEPAGAEREQVA